MASRLMTTHDNMDLESQVSMASEKEEPLPFSSSDKLIRQPSPALLRPSQALTLVQNHRREFIESQVRNSAKACKFLAFILWSIVAPAILLAVMLIVVPIVIPVLTMPKSPAPSSSPAPSGIFPLGIATNRY